MLQNRTYRGEITHQGTAYPGQHEAVLDPELWQIVQNKLAANRRASAAQKGSQHELGDHHVVELACYRNEARDWAAISSPTNTITPASGAARGA